MKTPSVGIITQARTTSTRLPRKVLMNLNGKTVLEHHLNRLKWSGFPVYVATTINKTDDPIVEFCEKHSVKFHRGSEQDVLSRFYECAKKFELDIIVRVTSDCPLIDGKLIKQGVQTFMDKGSDSYVSNCIQRTFPRGFDFEIFSMHSLEKAFNEATEQFEREHVTPFIRNAEKNSGIALIDIIRKENAGGFRITLDEEDDLKLMKVLFELHGMENKYADEIITFLKTHPEIAGLNAHVEQKKV
jgi:spore coat polysaccharide biosynthesis protein SpsF